MVGYSPPGGGTSISGGKAYDRSSRDPEHVVEITFNGDFDMAGLLRVLWILGGWGASRSVEVASGDQETQRDLEKKGYRTKFGWDGDGADKILSAKIDGKDILT